MRIPTLLLALALAAVGASHNQQTSAKKNPGQTTVKQESILTPQPNANHKDSQPKQETKKDENAPNAIKENKAADLNNPTLKVEVNSAKTKANNNTEQEGQSKDVSQDKQQTETGGNGVLVNEKVNQQASPLGDGTLQTNETVNGNQQKTVNGTLKKGKGDALQKGPKNGTQTTGDGTLKEGKDDTPQTTGANLLAGGGKKDEGCTALETCGWCVGGLVGLGVVFVVWRLFIRKKPAAL